MARQRFTKAERDTLVVGAPVEWLYVSHWKPGVVTNVGGMDTLGLPYVDIRYTGPTTGTLFHNDVVRGYPSHVRFPVPVIR